MEIFAKDAAPPAASEASLSHVLHPMPPSLPKLRLALPFSLASFGARLVARLIGSIALLLAVCLISGLQLGKDDARLQGLVSDTLAPVADVGRIQNDYNDILQTLTHAALTELPSSVDDAVTQIGARRVDIKKHWGPLKASGLGQKQRQLLALIDTHDVAVDQAVDETLTLLKAEQFDLARLKVSNDVQDAFGPLKSDFSNLFSLALSDGEAQAAAQHVANRHGLYALLIMVLVALGLTLWMDLRVMRSLTGRLAAATRLVTRIAQGRLGEPVKPGRNDEIGRLLHSLDGMDRQLVAVVRQVRHRAIALDQNATGIAEGNDALSQRTESQALHLERTSGSMARIAASLAESERLGKGADRAAAEARMHAEQGRLAVGEAAGSMEEIDRTSRSMGDMLDLIDKVAFQTRLLALNAAVEAARAGEHGRGFGVVATEVRELAQRCSEAAKDIRQLVTASDDAVRSGLERVSRAGEVIESIGGSVNRLAEALQVIVSSGRNQSSDIAAVNQSVIDMDAMTQENAALGEQAAAASRAMQESATALLSEMDFFKLDHVATSTPLPSALITRSEQASAEPQVRAA